MTAVDLAVERHVRETIAARLGDEHLVVGEELGGSRTRSAPPGGWTRWTAPPTWPTSLPWTSMSLALAMGGAPVVATVAQPALGHVFLAVDALGATQVGMPLELPRGTGLAGRTVLTVLDAHRRWPGMDRVWDRLAQQHATVRVVGSGTLALTGVAAGWAAGGVVHSFNPVDHLAGVLIAREAGAEVVGLDGVPRGFPIVGEPLVVAAPGLSAPLEAALLEALD